MIKFDLHIHSIASAYKEEHGIVATSTVENITILLDKLKANEVALFSITDHNRFDVELYKRLDEMLTSTDNPYSNIRGLLSGVEFDVKLEDVKEKCHIIAIFNAKSKEENYCKISTAINKHLLEGKDDYYYKESFEALLKEIGLDVILIACQRSSLTNHNGKHNSMSDSTSDPEKVVKIGYIDAMEFQKPKVEGILINNLNNISARLALFSGSDCHDWSQYPYHDKDNKNLEFYHSKAKILPTFKGLMMAVTSPETRFNCEENANLTYLPSFKMGERIIPLVNGINTIIGENGAGKSTIAKLLYHDLRDTYVQEIIKNNGLSVSEFDTQKIKYIGQGDIITKFNNNCLFSSDQESNFLKLDNTKFENQYCDYASKLNTCIQKTIEGKNAIDTLKDKMITYSELYLSKKYYVTAEYRAGFETVENQHAMPLKDIASIIVDIDAKLQTEYFHKYLDKITKSIELLREIEAEIRRANDKIVCEQNVKNNIIGAIDSYRAKIKASSSAKDNEATELQRKRQALIDHLLSAISRQEESIVWPQIPLVMPGVTQNQKRGFNFNREASYNRKDMSDLFLQKMFTKEYSNIEKIKSINTSEKFRDAVRGCTTLSEIERIYQENLAKFIKESTTAKDYITDSADRNVGNTLGEMSLSYYKFYTQGSDEWNVLIVDQPEDNISNNNVSKFLIQYFNSIRNNKQLILVTHNPLLVVNMDSDNVIYAQKKGQTLNIINGCLEFESEEVNILDIIADNMDGGKDSIEKRLQVYGKSNKVENESGKND